MSAAVPYASIGLQAATSVFEGFSQSSALKASAAVDNENARLSELQGAYNQEDIRRRGRAVQGEAIAAGADSGNGVANLQDLLFQNNLEIEYAAQSARYSAATEARGYRASAAQKKQAAHAAVIGGFLRAGAAAVTGAEKAIDTNKINAARAERQAAYFPGAQRLPMPTGGAYPGYGVGDL